MNLIIPQSLAQAILDYLIEQPYKEVAQIISELTQIKPEEKSRESDNVIL